MTDIKPPDPLALLDSILAHDGTITERDKIYCDLRAAIKALLEAQDLLSEEIITLRNDLDCSTEIIFENNRE